MPFRRKLKWLTAVDDRCSYFMAIMMFNVLHDNIPSYIKDMFQKQSDEISICLWHKLPIEITNLPSLPIFRLRLHQYLYTSRITVTILHMMQQGRHQLGQSKILLRTILGRQLSTISSRSMKPRRSNALFPAIIRMLVHSSAITSSSSSLSTTILSSSYLSSIVNGERINNNGRNNSGVSFCSSLLLSLLAWSVTLLLISSCFGIADAGVIMGHPLGKRSYIDLGCKGVYDKSIFARLDRVCEDCYNLFREPTLHTLCRKECFTTFYFKGCVDSLLMQDEMEQFKMGIKQLHGADPWV
ncbi:hypothetical protein PV325_004134 [Microctonus aethiopoides]|nr:hypothetical protein PV325_004134 [Microctonus aethiopoides]